MKSIKVGREPGKNDVVVNDNMVSRMHCEFIMDDYGSYRVVDMNSSNGTYVNGVRRQGETRLNPTDTVKIGNTILPWMNYFSGTPTTNRPGTTRIEPGVRVDYVPPVPQPKPGKGLAIAAMICGIAGFVLYGVGFILGVLGIVFGGISLSRKSEGRGMAITGLVMGIIDVLISVVALLVVGTLGLGLLSFLD